MYDQSIKILFNQNLNITRQTTNNLTSAINLVILIKEYDEVNFATQMSKLSNIFKMIRCLSNAFASSNLLTLERERVFQQFVNAVAQALNQNSLVVEKNK